MTSTSSPQATKQNWMDETVKHMVKEGRLKLFSGLIGANRLQRQAVEQAKNQEAESRWARKTLWGERQKESGGDDVGDSYLGDVSVQTHNHVAAPSTLGKIVSAALLATGVGAPLAIAAWKLPEIMSAFNPPKTIVQPTTPGDGNTKYKLRLGKPE